MANSSNRNRRESTVDFLLSNIPNNSLCLNDDGLTALYIIDSAAAHISDNDAAFNLLMTLHSQMSREYDAAHVSTLPLLPRELTAKDAELRREQESTILQTAIGDKTPISDSHTKAIYNYPASIPIETLVADAMEAPVNAAIRESMDMLTIAELTARRKYLYVVADAFDVAAETVTRGDLERSSFAQRAGIIRMGIEAINRHPAMHTWCFGGNVTACPTCSAHLTELNHAILSKRPFSNTLRGDIRTFNESNLPNEPITLDGARALSAMGVPAEYPAHEFEYQDGEDEDSDYCGVCGMMEGASLANHTSPNPAHISCDSCQALMIQGIFCHETGCPNVNARYDVESGEWVKQRKCFECGCTVDVDDSCCAAGPEDEE